MIRNLSSEYLQAIASVIYRADISIPVTPAVKSFDCIKKHFMVNIRKENDDFIAQTIALNKVKLSYQNYDKLYNMHKG
jgi:hypothetical protein